MSKAILVIDLPYSMCRQCMLFQSITIFHSVTYWCGGKSLIIDNPNVIQDFCPLKPIPERKKVGEIERVDDFMKSEIRVIAERVEAQIRLDTELLLATGYNACLDEILGDKK